MSVNIAFSGPKDKPEAVPRPCSIDLKASPPTAFPAFCQRRIEAVTDQNCLDCFHGHDQLQATYSLRTNCAAEHLVVPPSADPAIEEDAIVQAILVRAKRLAAPDSILQLITKWPFLTNPVVQGLEAAGRNDWIALVRKRIGEREAKQADCILCGYHSRAEGKAHCNKCAAYLQQRQETAIWEVA